MKRPILYILLYIILGILIGYLFDSLLVISILFIIVIGISVFLHQKYKLLFIRFLIFFAVISFIFTLNVKYKTHDYINSSIENESEISVVGTITKLEKDEKDSKFVLKVDKIYINGNVVYKNINLLVYSKYKDIKNGDIVQIDGNLGFANPQKNWSAYNEDLNFKIKNIDYKMYARHIKKLGHNEFIYYLDNIKQKAFYIYDEILPPKESGILKAMILGEKSFLDEDISSLYRNTGIYHILAISGLHIGILAYFLTMIFNKISMKYGKIFVILILVMYCILTGASISTIRATLMCITVLIGGIFYKNTDLISSISLSAIILLLINPYYLFDIGFMYSYTAVLSIAFLGSRFVDLYNMQGILKAFLVSFFVSIAIKPITAYYFHNLQIFDVFLNIIILPFMSIVVFIGFLVSIIGIFSTTLAEMFVGSVYYIFRFFTFMAKTIDNIELNNILVGRPDFIFILGFYTMLILIAYAIYDKYLLFKRRKFINIGICVFIICILISIIKPRPLEITMLDVGQGDSIACVSKDANFLIDGGGSNSSYSTGQNIVIPYFKSKGIEKLDFAFISHTDTDHIKGILDIIGDIQIDKIFLAKNTPIDENYIKLLDLIKEHNIDAYFLDRGDTINISDNLKIEVLHPNEDFINKDANNNSLVFKLIYNEKSILFTGDIEKSGENYLLDSNLDLSADILKIAHHGSKTSTTDEFLDEVNPEIALISAGEGNPYNHPSDEIIGRLENENIEIYRTDLSNAINIKIYGNRIKIETIN